MRAPSRCPPRPCCEQAENDHHIKDTYNYVTVQARKRHGGNTADVLMNCSPSVDG